MSGQDDKSTPTIGEAAGKLIDAAANQASNKPDASAPKKNVPQPVRGGMFGGYDSLSDFVTVKVPTFGFWMSFCSNLITYVLFQATMREQWWPNADRFLISWTVPMTDFTFTFNPALVFIYALITLWGESFTVKYVMRLFRYWNSAGKLSKYPELKADKAIVKAHLASEYWLKRNIGWLIPALVVTCLDLFAAVLDMTAGATTLFAWVMMFAVAFISVFSGEVFFAMQQDGLETSAENGRNVLDVLREREAILRYGVAPDED